MSVYDKNKQVSHPNLLLSFLSERLGEVSHLFLLVFCTRLTSQASYAVCQLRYHTRCHWMVLEHQNRSQHCWFSILCYFRWTLLKHEHWIWTREPAPSEKVARKKPPEEKWHSDPKCGSSVMEATSGSSTLTDSFVNGFLMSVMVTYLSQVKLRESWIKRKLDLASSEAAHWPFLPIMLTDPSSL